MSDNVTLSTVSDSEQGNHYPTQYTVLNCPNHVLVKRTYATSHGPVTMSTCPHCGITSRTP